MRTTNHRPKSLLSLLFAACLPLPATAETKSSTSDGNANADARAEANATGTEKNASTQKQTVTVTSDGKNTIKKTVTVRDGKEETTTETTDENGNTTVDRSGGANHKPGATGPEDGPWLGLRAKEPPAALRDQLDLAEDEGVLVDVIAPDGPAAKAGLKINDLLLKLADRKLATPQDLRDELKMHKPGETVALTVLRKGKPNTVEVTLGQRPAGDGAQEPPQDAKLMLEHARKMLENQPGNSKVEVEVSGTAGLDAILNNPEVPEDFKKTVREMRQRMLDFEKRHQPK